MACLTPEIKRAVAHLYKILHEIESGKLELITISESVPPPSDEIIGSHHYIVTSVERTFSFTVRNAVDTNALLPPHKEKI